MTGRGRPTTGVRVDVRIDPGHLAVIDGMARANGITRAEQIRRILTVIDADK